MPQRMHAARRHPTGFDTSDLFDASEPSGPLSPGQRFAALRLGQTFTLGEQTFAVMRDSGTYEKALGDPEDPYTIRYLARADEHGVVTVHRIGKHEYRPGGKPVVRGQLGAAPQAALGMDPGEWWIDEHGYVTFADGDVGTRTTR